MNKTVALPPIKSSHRVQELVDEHARLGMMDSAIRDHLRDRHSVDPTEHIPLPSARARKDRDAILSGDLSRISTNQGTVLYSPGMIPAGIAPAPSTSPLPDAPSIAAPDITWERPTVGDLIATAYRSVGPTTLDRLIAGLGPIIANADDDHESTSFEAVQRFGRHLMADLPVDENGFGEVFDPLTSIFAGIEPWLRDQAQTINLQIDLDLAEALLESSDPPVDSWKERLRQTAFYLDVANLRDGERAVSAIFSRPEFNPVTKKQTFQWMAIVEWGRRGYECFIHGDEDQFDIFMAYDDAPESEQATADLYDGVPELVLKLLSTAVLHHDALYAREVKAPVLLPTRSRTDSSPHRSVRKQLDKKLRAKDKTHSYFRIRKLFMKQLANSTGLKGATRKPWSLDHRITVSGHFRWQPFGAGLSKHKLVWIDAYDKGQGGRVRPLTNPTILQDVI